MTFAIVFGAAVWAGMHPMLAFVLGSPVFLPAYLWSLHAVRCPGCGERWLWTQATRGTTPSLAPAMALDACRNADCPQPR